MISKICLSLLIILSVTNVVQSQVLYNEVAYLKNGSIIKGVITEEFPGQSMKIQTKDGNLFVFDMAELDHIAWELVVEQQFRTSTEQSAAVIPTYTLYLFNGTMVKGMISEKIPGQSITIKSLENTFVFNESDVKRITRNITNENVIGIGLPKQKITTKNGSAVKGIIIEWIPDKSYKLRTNDGSTFVFNLSDIDKITIESTEPARMTPETPATVVPTVPAVPITQPTIPQTTRSGTLPIKPTTTAPLTTQPTTPAVVPTAAEMPGLFSRKGFMIGLGLGGSSVSVGVGNKSESYTSFIGDVKIGAFVNNQVAIYYTGSLNAFTITDEDGASTLNMSGINALGVSYYFMPKKGSPYINLFVGESYLISDVSGDADFKDKLLSGIGGFGASLGYEFAKGIAVELDYNSGNVTNDALDALGVECKLSSVAFKLSFLLY
jgi:hypothetical protein